MTADDDASRTAGPAILRSGLRGHGALLSDPGEDLKDRPAVVDFQSLPAGDLKLMGVEPELMEDGCVDVGHVVAVLDGMEADLVGRAVDDAPLHAAAGQPGGEALGVVV